MSDAEVPPNAIDQFEAECDKKAAAVDNKEIEKSDHEEYVKIKNKLL